MIENCDDFINFIHEKQIKNILIGNGFCLSHPSLNIQWTGNELKNEMMRFINEFEKNKINCCETFLSNIRKFLIELIVGEYVKNFKFSLEEKNTNSIEGFYTLYKNTYGIKYSSSGFLSIFDNIFTVNYDPLMYLELLELKKFKDGFNGNKFSSLDKIVSNLNEGYRIFYLHGSWFIIKNKQNDELKKISFSNKLKGKQPIFSHDNQEYPFLILEDRWRVKKTLIEENKYFKYCKKCLENLNSDLLVFGMSFNFDDHIILSLNELKSKKYIAVIDHKNKENLESKFKKYQLNNYEFIEISENVIWKKSGLT